MWLRNGTSRDTLEQVWGELNWEEVFALQGLLTGQCKRNVTLPRVSLTAHKHQQLSGRARHTREARPEEARTHHVDDDTQAVAQLARCAAVARGARDDGLRRW